MDVEITRIVLTKIFSFENKLGKDEYNLLSHECVYKWLSLLVALTSVHQYTSTEALKEQPEHG